MSIDFGHSYQSRASGCHCSQHRREEELLSTSCVAALRRLCVAAAEQKHLCGFLSAAALWKSLAVGMGVGGLLLFYGCRGEGGGVANR